MASTSTPSRARRGRACATSASIFSQAGGERVRVGDAEDHAAGVALMRAARPIAPSTPPDNPTARPRSRASTTSRARPPFGDCDAERRQKRLALIFRQRAGRPAIAPLAAYRGGRIARPRPGRGPYAVARAIARSARSGERKNANPAPRKAAENSAGNSRLVADGGDRHRLCRSRCRRQQRLDLRHRLVRRARHDRHHQAADGGDRPGAAPRRWQQRRLA